MIIEQPSDIHTEHLALIPITSASVAAEEQNHLQLGAITHADVPAEWPPEHWEPHVLALLKQRFAVDPAEIGWHRYVALRMPNGARTLIGTMGGFIHAQRPKECEIGYSILPEFQQRGFATEGMKAFLRWAFEHPAIRSAVAQTFPHLPASIRVMEKLGMRLEGPGFEEGTILYRLRPPATL